MVTFLFLGERLCLDFVNTEIVDGGVRVDLLRGFDDLVDWCVGAAVIGRTEATVIRRRWVETAEGRDAHRRAIAFRATLRAMLEDIAAGRGLVAPRVLDAINAVLDEGACERRVVRAGDGYEMRVRRIVETPGQLLAAVAESAATLLTTDDLTRLRTCQNPECLLVFYDTTRNHARRWCSMAACGNRAKVAAHYRRGRQPAPRG
jgi:predicted RNA-binding Zn ribbon-like protein